MSAPLSRTRRLSSVWDNFRNKYRKTRIDSLLSPPNLDSGDDKKSGYSDPGGKLLPSDYDSDRSPGSTGRQSFSEDEVVSPCDSKLPDFQFPPAISGFEVGGDEENESDGTSSDQDGRIAAAIDNFTVEATEPEDIGRYFSHDARKTGDDATISEQISPTGSMDTGASADSTSGLLHSDNSGSTLSFEVGVPLQRTVANRNLQQWKTQVQTEPQTAEQSLAQSTYISLDEVVHDTGWMVEEQERAKHKEREVPRTVDGVRLDARPLIRHTGTSAPPHSSLQLHTFASRQQHIDALDEGQVSPKKIAEPVSEASTSQTMAAPSAQRRPQPISWFSSSSDSSVQSLRLNLTNQTYRRRSTIRPPPTIPLSRPQLLSSSPSQQPITSKRHQTTNETVLGVPTSSSISNTSNPFFSAPSSYPPKPPKLATAAPTSHPKPKIEYSHTPPRIHARQIQSRRVSSKPLTAYTSLSTPSAISTFHSTLTSRLHLAISSGDIKASQVPVKERVRRISGKSLQQGLQQGVARSGRAVRRWSVGVGEAVVAGGGLGVGWGDVGGGSGMEEEMGVGKRSASVYYGGGFV
ncbi:hypothetical protein D6D27_04113 [Aureobasidium pullulans]|nr:hypothetical protein D6D27_04113 [Aureobasidium pullulans]